MKIAFFGASNFAVTKVIPEVMRSNLFSEIAVASKSSGRVSSLSSEIEIFGDYQQALKDFPADIVYVSTVNSDHYKLSKLALEAGKHVLVDKPATTNHDQTRELVQIAKRNNLLISEALFYEYHPQIAVLKHLISTSARIQHISVVFTVPTFHHDNFRYKKELGGGVLFDMGPYAASIARVLCQENVNDIVVKLTEFSSESLPLSFSLMCTLASGAILSGYFGFNSEYTNRVEILGEDIRILVDRIFTTPPEYKNQCRLVKNNIEEERLLPIGSSIQCYFSEIANALSSNSFSTFSEIMLQDAEVLYKLSDNLNSRGVE